MSPEENDEQRSLLAVALRNAESIGRARERAEAELLRSKQALEEATLELAQSLAALRATLDATADAIIVTDHERQIIDFNERYRALWQPPQALLEARDHRRLVEWKARRRFVDPAAFVGRVEEIFGSDTDETFDLLETTDGKVLERTSRRLRIRGADAGRVWSYRDITELRDEARALELLNRANTEIASTLDLPTLLQAVTDHATRLSGAAFGAFFYNAHDEHGDGYRLHTVSGAAREDFAGFAQPRATPLFGPTSSGRQVVRCADVRADPRHDRWAPHHGMLPGHLPVRSYLAVPVVSLSKEVIGGLFFGHPEAGVFGERSERLVVGIATQAAAAIDNARLYAQAMQLGAEREALLDAERSARTAAERLGRTKDDFLATLSHELRTPLMAILGWAAVLARGGDADIVARGVDAIMRSAKAQSQLIDDLLDMGRIVSGKVRLDVQPTDLAAVIDAALDVVRPAAEAKEITLRRVLDPRAGPVSGDAQRLQQVVWNLLSNAVKFTPKGGRIDVRLERVGSQVEITVADTGAGISTEFLPHVFDRFSQSDESITRKHGGLGLGLSIVRHLVELHGGSVTATSAGLGEGATFCVRLPLAPVRTFSGASHPAVSAGIAWDEAALALHGVRVLVVEDDADARELLRELLMQFHAEVSTAQSADEGLARLGEVRPDVIVSDIGMPDVDGYEFIRRVRRLPSAAGGNTPAIALTAFARPEDRVRALLAGYQSHIAKPIEPHELTVTVSSLVRRVGVGGD
jgi:signal transduction histidine kinase/CheY-like chemotaxis protein/PAS domain-containing protein